MISSVTITTQTALKPPAPPALKLPPSIEGDHQTTNDRIETAKRREALSATRAQPHRRGDGSPLAGIPLGRFCKVFWPNDEDHRSCMLEAGMTYDRVVRDELVARGLPYIGAAPGRTGDAPEELTSKKIEDLRKDISNLTRKVKDADNAVRCAHPSAPSIIRKVCYEQREWGPYEEGILANALYLLADHLGLIDHGINALD
jgi:hypothetical protein